MRSGLFKQYFTIFIVTLLSCTGLLGITLLLFSGANYTQQRQETLVAAAQSGTEAAAALWTGADFDRPALQQALTALGTGSTSVYVADLRGTVIACSEKECHHGKQIPAAALKALSRDDDYFAAGYFEGFFRNNGDYIFGTPVFSGDVKVGYLFASTSVLPLFSYLSETLFTYVFSTGVMLLGAFVVVYTATLRLTTPLQQMSRAAASFGKGDFSARVSAEGDDEIAGLANSFNRMAESLAEHEQNRRSFVANVSHDLRTPMTTIGGYIDGILDGTIPKEQQDHYLGIVSEEVKRLSRLTSSLLSVTRLEERQTNIELVPVDAWDLILNIMFNLEKRIEEKQIYVPDFVTEDCFVKADKDMLHQVVYNLIDNAVKYTPVGGEIAVSAKTEGEITRIVVRNTGRGIALAEQPYIFERFYKTDKSRSLDKGGTGLGLYIVKMLTAGMDGAVAVESDGESYTQFTVTLNSAPVPKERLAKERAAREREALEKQSSVPLLSWFKPKPKKDAGDEGDGQQI